MAPKSVTASAEETAFDCPHCGAYTTQTWYTVYAKALRGGRRIPFLARDFLAMFETDEQSTPEEKERTRKTLQKTLAGLVGLSGKEEYVHAYLLDNLHLSRCFNCRDFGVWVNDRLISPALKQGPSPNPDLPEDVRLDYEEAATILNLSPRGSAALLRLAIQKLCVALGERGKKLDDDIGSLVKKGLSPVVQMALDSVRVLGNEAVHPGVLDLRDDVDTAKKLFPLVNIIAEQLISNQKHVAEVYKDIPEGKRKAIEIRDGKTGKIT